MMEGSDVGIQCFEYMISTHFSEYLFVSPRNEPQPEVVYNLV
jgi:hypothetical protein